MLVATRYGDVGKQSTHFISSYTSMRNPYSTTFTAKDGNTRVPSTYLQVTASTEKGRGSFWKDLSPGSRRSEDPKWFCSRFLFPPFLIKKKKKKSTQIATFPPARRSQSALRRKSLESVCSPLLPVLVHFIDGFVGFCRALVASVHVCFVCYF